MRRSPSDEREAAAWTAGDTGDRLPVGFVRGGSRETLREAVGVAPRDASALAASLDLPHVAWFGEVTSTMDVADALAREGAPAGTLVLADTQSRGRGRSGKTWASRPGAGVWMTMIERPIDASGLDVLSLRVGMRAARALDRFVPSPLQLKWPTDLMTPAGKVGGILVEVRWREHRPEWVAIGIGINLASPMVAVGASLGAGATREAVLGDVVPALRAAAAARGGLGPRELEEYAARDWARGRRVVAPHAGIVAGITADGAVLIETPGGVIPSRSGSLVFEGEQVTEHAGAHG